MAVRFELNRAGVRELLRSPAIQANLAARARRVASAAGPGHGVDSTVGANRARATVWTDTYEARRAEAKERRLTRAFNAARG